MIAEAIQAHQAGCHDRAGLLARQAAVMAADNADAYHLMGIFTGQSGNRGDSLSLFCRAIRLHDQGPQFHSNLAAMLHNWGQAEMAAEVCRRALARDPLAPDALYALAAAEDSLARDSLRSHRRHLLVRPDHAESGYQLARLLLRNRPVDAAIQTTRVLAIRPDCHRTLFVMGQACRAISGATDVERCYRRALAVSPEFTDAICVLGVLAEDRRRDPTPWYKTALAWSPAAGGALVNLGQRHWEAKRRNQAVAHYRRALALDPADASARCCLAVSLLASGRYREGWEHYEWRWQHPRFVRASRSFQAPPWNGEPLAGRILLIHAEQGLGDILQFCRFAGRVGAGGRVILEAYPPLMRLLSTLPGVERVVAQGDPLPEFDLHCPLLSLPRILGTTPETIPPTPYLAAEDAAVCRWRRRIADSPSLRVGLVWSGGPHAEQRSMPFEAVLPLLTIPGIQIFSLQVGERTADLAGTPQIDDLSPGLVDFAETAAALTCLDLIVTVDTSVAHLAGALGRPTWVLLPCRGNWRWMLDRQDSPWYPTVRLFRQTAEGDWPGVVAQLGAALKIAEDYSFRDIDRAQP